MAIAHAKTRTTPTSAHPCECGCGAPTPYRFVRGHASRRPEIRKQYAKNLSALNGSRRTQKFSGGSGNTSADQ